MNERTSRETSSWATGRRIWRSLRCKYKQDDVTLGICCLMLSSASSRSPRSWTTADSWMTLALTVSFMMASWTRRESLSNHVSSVLFSLNFSRWDSHQLQMSVVQSCRWSCTSSTPCWRTPVCHPLRDGILDVTLHEDQCHVFRIQNGTPEDPGLTPGAHYSSHNG